MAHPEKFPDGKIVSFKESRTSDDSDESESDPTKKDSCQEERSRKVNASNEQHELTNRESFPISSERSSPKSSQYHGWSLSNDGELDGSEEVLPSRVTDREYIYMPPNSSDDDEEIIKGGKWMIFPKGDINKLDEYWIALQPLYRNGTFVRLKCSTALGSEPGVVNCYTTDSENMLEVKKAADALRDVTDHKKNYLL